MCVCVWCTDNSWGWAGVGDYTLLCHFIMQYIRMKSIIKELSSVGVFKKWRHCVEDFQLSVSYVTPGADVAHYGLIFDLKHGL